MRNKIYRHEGVLTEADISHFIHEHQMNDLPRLRMLKDYFLGDHAILRRTYEPFKPDARQVHNFANYITNQATSYFMGTPISYTSEDEAALQMVQDILTYNDEADMNATHAENMSIYGVSYELLYVDKDSYIDTRFAVINPEEMIVIYDYALEPNIIAAIRYYEDTIGTLNVEYYDNKSFNVYSGSINGLTLVESTEHFFKDVPVAVYINNNNRQGDYEQVLTLIDEYNLLNSDTANDFQYFSDAYLFLSGATIDNEDAINMKENRIINIDDPSAKAEWLVKNIQDTALENYKDRIVNDIHKFSAVPNLTDESFASNLSGVAIKYKLLGLENLAAMKERKFKKGIQRRFELLFNLLYTRGKSAANYMAIKPTFKRSLPANLVEETEMVRNLQGITSKETMLSLLSFIEDVQAELEQIEKEREESNAFIDEAYTAEKLGELEVADTDEQL